MSYSHMADILSFKPAEGFGWHSKGDSALGFEADIALVGPRESFLVHSTESESKRGYSPFEGLELAGRVKATFLRGVPIYDGGKITGRALGQYLRRPG